MSERPLPNRLRELLDVRPREVYLSTEEAAQLLGRPNRKQFLRWARRHHVPLRCPEGSRQLVVKKSDLDWVLRERQS